MTPAYVLFDCDGVLVDSEPITNRIMQANLAAHGLDLRVDQIFEMFVGGTMQGVMTRGRELGADLPDNWLDLIYAQMFAALEAECQVIPGVPQMLDRLEIAGIGYAVGSNGPRAKMEVTLAKCGLAARLKGRVFSAYECAAPKPAPDVYLKAAAAAGMSPEVCVVVEDSATGARAGQAAGMRVLGYGADADCEKLGAYCDMVFMDMGELPALLGL